jgi:hypothetical protein
VDNTRFTQVEREYFRLKGLLAAGRLSQQAFEDALKPLVTQDEQGRHWMLGVDDAKWYVYDGRSWIRQDPPGSMPSRPVANSVPAAPPRPGSRLPFFALGGGIALLCVCGMVAVFLAMNPGLARINSLGSPTPFIMPTPFIPSTPTFAPSSTIPPAPTLTVLPTATRTQTPSATATTPRSPVPTATLTPTPTATLTPTPTATLTPTPTATPIITPRPQGNCADPNARWENVVDGQTLDAYHAFLGTAYHEKFMGYVVEWVRPGNVLHRSTTPVTRGVIFVWNTYTVDNGVYPVALTVFLTDGTTLASCVVVVRVAH